MIKPRLGILLTHPVQYYAPWFREISVWADVMVYYAHQQNAQSQSDAGFNVAFEWDIPLLSGYDYQWLTNVSKKPHVDYFSGCDTPEISAIIQQQKFDAFLVFGWNLKTYWQAIWACKRLSIPVFIRGDSQLRTGRSIWKKMLKYPLYRLALPWLGYYLSPGRRNAEYLKHYGVPNEHIFHVPHCVDTVRFQSMAQQGIDSEEVNKIRIGLGLKEKDFLVLFVGKLIDKKRPRDCIKACLQLPVHVAIIGDGPLLPTLQAEFSDQAQFVHFMGFQNQSVLPHYYTACDLLVLPSDGGETWGLVINEVQACGRPVIVSDQVGCAPDLVDGLTGQTFACGNIDALAIAIDTMQKTIEQQPMAVKQAIIDKVNNYSMQNASIQFCKALNLVLQRQGGRVTTNN